MFSDEAVKLLDLPAFATLATLLPDGTPQLTVMWYRRVGDELEMVTPADTKKVGNLERDNRATVVVTDPVSSYRYIEMRGRIELKRDPHAIRESLFKIATRYIGQGSAEPYTAARDPNVRTLLVFHPEQIHDHFAERPVPTDQENLLNHKPVE